MTSQICIHAFLGFFVLPIFLLIKFLLKRAWEFDSDKEPYVVVFHFIASSLCATIIIFIFAISASALISPSFYKTTHPYVNVTLKTTK